MNLDHFIDMNVDSWHGEVVNLSELTNQFKENTWELFGIASY